MIDTSMQATIDQWVLLQRKKAEEKSASTLAKTIIERTMKALQTAIDENNTPEELIFCFNDNGECYLGGLGDKIDDIHIPNEKTSKAVCSKVKEAFKAIPRLNVWGKNACYEGVSYTEFHVRVKTEEET